MSKAILFDRDGTIIEDKNYLSDPREIVYLDGFFQGYKILQDMGFDQYLITNQSGVGRGFFTLEQVNLVHHQIQRDLINQGLRPFKDIKICPHKPEDACSCRKPNPQMAQELIYKYSIEVEKSFLLGDKTIDLEMAKNAKVQGILIPSPRSPQNLAEIKEPSFANVLDFAHHLSKGLPF